MKSQEPRRPAAHSTAPHHAPKKTKKRRRARIIAASIAAGFMVVVSCGLIAAAGWINNLLGNIDTPDPVNPSSDAVIADPLPPVEKEVKMLPSDYEAQTVDEISLKGNSGTVTNYLVLGVNPNDHLADTNILISINTKTRTIQIISLMRDVLVQVQNQSGTWVEWKLNAAHSWGRIPGHKAMIEKNFRLEVDRYVTMDFGVFSYAIDQIGGIDIELTAQEAQAFAGGSTAGTYHLDGEAALAYSRERHMTTLDGYDDDWGRTERQRRVVEAAFNKAKQNPFDVGLKLPDIVAQANIVTTMRKDDLVELAVQGLMEYKDYTLENHVIADHGTYRGKTDMSSYGSALELTDPVQTVLTLHEWIYGKEQ